MICRLRSASSLPNTFQTQVSERQDAVAAVVAFGVVLSLPDSSHE